MSHDFLDSSEQILNETKSPMKLKKAIKILSYHNNWRRGFVDEPKYTPSKIGVAIYTVIRHCEKTINHKTHTSK